MDLRERVDGSREALLGELNEFLRMPSISASEDGGEEFRRCAEWVAEKLREAGEKWGAATGEGTTSILERLAEAEPHLKVIALSHGRAVAESIALGMARNGTTVFEEAKRQGVNIDKGVGTNRTRRPPIHPELEGMSAIESALIRASIFWLAQSKPSSTGPGAIAASAGRLLRAR